ncbi:perilipin-1 isoform X3 [Erpetoichthys calabaricus]|uniref:perilipin-1 isoform X3 n=1 Tax=Erpetoichthys calabaricus TaxID=27687 RepID=UPI002234D856|nr:perilipin-1 isoform X3 [Erpetoichthys calabaricus]
MASEKLTPEQSSGAQDSLLGRLFELPVVSFTYGVVQKTYTSTKHTHPLICTVCDVYEKGVKTASSIVVWTIQPAIQKLEPQIVAVNHLACKGLDHLEEKIPALQLPPEKLASHIIEVVSSTVQTASDAVFHVMSSSYDQTRGVMEDATDYIFSTRPAKLAAEGVDAALTVTERIVNYVLPGSEEERACVAASATDSQPSSYRRLGTLASTVFRRTYNQTATKLRKARAQGQELVMWIPGISPLLSRFNEKEQMDNTCKPKVTKSPFSSQRTLGVESGVSKGPGGPSDIGTAPSVEITETLQGLVHRQPTSTEQSSVFSSSRKMTSKTKKTSASTFTQSLQSSTQAVSKKD